MPVKRADKTPMPERDAGARAHRLYDTILSLKREGAIDGDRDNTPKVRPPKTAVL